MDDFSIESRDEQVDRLLRGAIDMHCHSGPSLMPRDLDHVQAAREAAAAGLRAIVLKDHFYSATPIAALLNRNFAELNVQVHAGIALNNSVGGLNPHAVEHSLRLGGKVVWMPTFSAANHIDHLSMSANAHAKEAFPKANVALPASPLCILDRSGALHREIDVILKLVAEADAVLAGGHLGIKEIWPLFRRARELGVRKLLVNHPTFVVGASDDDIRGLAALGAYIEHSICMFDDRVPVRSFLPAELKRLIFLAGPERTILGSDLGQANLPHPVDGMRWVIRTCLDLGFDAADVRKMIADNPAHLLGMPLLA